MARFARIVMPGVPCHVTQRGNNQQDVFFVDDDRRVHEPALEKPARAPSWQQEQEALTGIERDLEPGYVGAGVDHGWRSLIAARPISLLLRDGARDLRDCFHLTGHGRWTKWNNTGVCNRFACSNGALNVPKNKQADASASHWAVCNESGLMIAVHSAGPALLAVFPDWKNSPDELLQAINQANPREPDLAHTFHWPGAGTVEYDVNAPKDTWVIASIDGKPVDRPYDRWPQMDGDGPKITFAR